MVTVSVRHMRERRGQGGALIGYYFIPSASMLRAGFRPEPLGEAPCDRNREGGDV